METADVVIAGSGYGGSILAARLAAAGMKVVVLERGARLGTGDFRQSDDPRYIQSILDVVVSSTQIAFRTGKLVGGASPSMDGAHFRAPTATFEQKDPSGRRYWPAPYTRAALDPYYARAEQMLKIRQIRWDEVSRAGGLFAKMLNGAGASCDRARMNYLDCRQCGFCAQGCRFDKKVDMLHSYVPLAEAKGATFRSGSLVRQLRPSGTGYKVLYLQGGVEKELETPRAVVAGGGLHSPALLLRSRDQLVRLSAQVGEHFNTNGEHAFVGFLPPEFDDLSRYHCYQGMDNAGVMCFEWFESHGFTLHPGGGLEPSLFSGAFAAKDHPVLPKRAFGVEYKRFAEAMFPHRVIGFSSLGLAGSHRAVVLRADGTPDIVERDRTEYDAYLDKLESVVFEVGRKTGVTLVPAVPRRHTGTTSTHLLASCRMAETAQHGVVDADCQVFGHENLYVCDASAIPYALGVNPALTLSAVAERCAERIIAKG